MDALKGLKYALVMVLIVSAALLGWTTYLERRLDRRLDNFSHAVAEAQTENQAQQVIRSFLIDAKKAPTANSASADSQVCNWLCQQ